jgi:TldD protein
MRVRAAFAGLLFVGAAQAAEPPAEDALIFRAMRAELARAKDLSLPGAKAPYYVGYWVVDEHERSAEATLGALVSDDVTDDRFVKLELRVGSPALDNSNFTGTPGVDSDFMKDAELLSPRAAPIDDDETAIRRELWLATDAAYKGAVEALEKKRAGRESEIATRAEVDDFSPDKSPEVVTTPSKPLDAADLAQIARRVSSVFRSFPLVQKSNVRIVENATRRRFVASDGGLAVEPLHTRRVEISCEGQAEDGMSLTRNAFVPVEVGGAIPEARAKAEALRLAKDLVELHGAHVTEDYSGPVLFEGKAAAQLVYELLGEALSGTPAAAGNEDLDSTLSRKLGKRILPRGIGIIDDPALTVWEGTPLLGHYAVDDEGMQAERTLLVEDGHLKGFLMGRTPRESFTHSNGHGRSGLVGWARGRPGNLVMSAKHGLSNAELRAKLMEAVHDEGGDYGIVVDELQERTSSSNGDAMPAPEMAYKVTPSGERTLLRGATFSPIAVRELRDVLAVGQKSAVYSFIIENDDGLDLPTSIVAPALLLEDVEVRGPVTPNKKPPIVPPPGIAVKGDQK